MSASLLPRSWSCDSVQILMPSAVVLALGSVGPAQQFSFETNLGVPTARIPRACVEADVDADGDLDLLVATQTGLSVCANLGDVGFGPHVDVTSGSAHIAIAAGDLDGDGDVDAVTVSQNFPTGAHVFKNDGAGTFTLFATHAIGSVPAALVLADFDGDLDQDVAVTDSLPGRVGLLRNTGGGALAAPVWTSDGHAVASITAADFDQDGDVDVATVGPVSLGGVLVAVLGNDGSGIFSSASSEFITPTTTHVSAADIDQDGDVDLLVGTFGGILVKKNLGGGSMAASVGFGVANALGTFDLADVDADLDLDAFFATSDGVVRLTNDGTGAFTAPSVLALRGFASRVVAADFDGDGDVDVAAPTPDADAVFLAENTGGAFPTPTVVSGTGNHATALADLDADLDLDAIVLGPFNAFQVLRNDGTAAISAIGTYATPTGPESVALGDVDGDGDVDVVVGTTGQGRFNVFKNQGGAVFALTTQVVVPAPAGLALGDADLDGDLDLWLTRAGVLDLYSNPGTGAFAVPTSYSAPGSAAGIQLADVDADGDLDAVVPATGSLGILRNTSGVLAPYSSVPLPGATNAVTVADFDGDGDLDLAASSFGTGVVTIAWSNGGASFSPGPSVVVSSSPYVVTSADIDLDGRIDIATVDIDSFVTLVRNAGGGVFDRETRIGPAGPWGIAFGDLDRDGDPDLVVPGAHGGGTLVVRNALITGASFCNGDGSAATCPCGNTSAPGADAGCLHSFSVGATLRGSGGAALTADHMVLRGANMPATATVLYFQGTLSAGGGIGQPFGDGLRCAGGVVQRLGTKVSIGGASQYPGPLDAKVSVRGVVIAPGERVYQAWYRNAAVFCTSSAFNLTNGWRVLWRP